MSGALLDSTVSDLSSALAAKKISSVELTQGYLDRIAKINPALNAFITLDAERALDQAKAADARIAAGNSAPLTGWSFPWRLLPWTACTAR